MGDRHTDSIRVAVCAVAILSLWSVRPQAQPEGTDVDTPKHTNRLINSTSPYLLQHAHNPVDWYPWGTEAIERARREDKPLFVSIGYSSCHWCHVMERESFENEETAAIMNKYFVCVKVDREERPDIDNIYMSAVQMMGGRGGWPLNVFLTPDLKPFYGGTYFPPKDYANMPGFPRVLNSIAKTYKEKRDLIEQNSTQIIDALNKSLRGPSSGIDSLDDTVIKKAVTTLHDRFDKKWGGFSKAPKFPSAGSIDLLLRYHYRTGDKNALEMATTTLENMARGGMYDHVGGGFHRYSVDTKWLVPHFEKMLYDNAQLADVYLKAWQVTGDPMYRRVGQETLDYILRDMTDPAGGFYSAEDADSSGTEGAFYLWDATEIDQVLGPDDGAVFRRYYGVTSDGNFEGHNILNIPVPLDKFAVKEGIEPDVLRTRLAKWNEKVRKRRDTRERPRTDDKVLADWNGLAISAFARGYEVIGDVKYLHAAERAAEFVTTVMTTNGQLHHTYRAGRSHIDAMLDDYAFMSQGCIDLYEASLDTKWIERATGLADTMIQRLADTSVGGFYETPAGQSDVLVRSKSAFDSAVPAGNSVAIHVLSRLAALTDKKNYTETADRAMRLFSTAAVQYPLGYTQLLNAYDFRHGPIKDVVIVGGKNASGTRQMFDTVYQTYLPNRVVAWTSGELAETAKDLNLIPALKFKTEIDGRPTAYVCHGKVCYAPITAIADLKKRLAEK